MNDQSLIYCGHIEQGEALYRAQFIVNAAGEYLCFASDGNLFHFDAAGNTVATSDTAGAGVVVVFSTSDDVLVINGMIGDAVWSNDCAKRICKICGILW